MQDYNASSKKTPFFFTALLLLCCLFFVGSPVSYGQSKKTAKEAKKAKKKSKKRKKGRSSNKPFNYRPRTTGKGTKQDDDKNKTGGSGGRKVKPDNKQDRYATKAKRTNNRYEQDKKRESTGGSSGKKVMPDNKQDRYAVKKKSTETGYKQDVERNKAGKKTAVEKKPSTEQNKYGVGMVKKKRSEKNKRPVDLSKTTVKVPVVNYRKTDRNRIKQQDKLKTADMPARKNKAPLDDTYMIKVKRQHKKQGLPDKNPVEFAMKRSTLKETKNPRPEISKYQGDYKKPRRFYAQYLAWKNSKELNNSKKLYTTVPAGNRKIYRKRGRKMASWQGEIKVLRRHKHDHPSLRFQVYKHKPKGADVVRTNKRLKKAKYDPNERKIWEPKDEYSTY